MLTEEKPTLDELIDLQAHKLRIFVSGIDPDSAEDMKNIGCKVIDVWSDMPEWEKDDYRFAVKKFLAQLPNELLKEHDGGRENV